MPAAQTPQAAQSEDIELENPFFSDGELSDIDEEAAERLFAASVGEEPPAPVKEPEAVVVEETSDADLGDLKEPDAADKSDEPKDDVLKNLFEKPRPKDPEEKKQENKGLRTQARDLAQQREQLQAQLEERDAELERMREEMRRVEEEKSTFQKTLNQKYEVGRYDPNSDPDVQRLDKRLDLELKKAHIALGPEYGPIFTKHAATLADRYNKAIESGNVDDFYALIQENFPDSVQVVADQVGRVSDILAERGEIQTKNQENFFKTSIGGWEEKRKGVSETVAQIGRMTAEEAQAAMDSEETATNAVLSLVAQNYPEFNRVLDDIKKRTATFITGVRPFDIRDARWERYLDPTDPTQLSEEGKRIRDAEIFNHQRSQEFLPQRLAEGLAASKLLPVMAKRIADLEKRLGGDQGTEVDPDIDTGDAEGGSRGFAMSEEDLDDPNKLVNPYLDDI